MCRTFDFEYLLAYQTHIFVQFYVPLKTISAHRRQVNQWENPEKNHLAHPQAELTRLTCALCGAPTHTRHSMIKHGNAISALLTTQPQGLSKHSLLQSLYHYDSLWYNKFGSEIYNDTNRPMQMHR